MLGRQQIGIYLSNYESARKLGYLDQARLSIYDRKPETQRQGETRPRLVTETFANGEDHAETIFGKDYVDGYRRGVSQSKLLAEGASKTAGELYLSNIKTLIDTDAVRLKSSVVKSMTQGMEEYSVQKATRECARMWGWDVVFNTNTIQSTRRIIERWINVRAANIRRERRKTQKWDSQSSEEVYETLRTIQGRVVDESTSSYAKRKIKEAKEEAEREATLDEDEIVQRAIDATVSFSEFCDVWKQEREYFKTKFKGEDLKSESAVLNDFQNMANDVNTQMNVERLMFPEMDTNATLEERHRDWAEAITAAAPYALAHEEYKPIKALRNWSASGIKILLMYMQSQIEEVDARRSERVENVIFVQEEAEKADQTHTEARAKLLKLREKVRRIVEEKRSQAAQKHEEAEETKRKQEETRARKERVQKALLSVEKQSKATQQRNEEQARAQRENQEALESAIGRFVHPPPKEFVKIMKRQRKASEAVAAAQKQEENAADELEDSLGDSLQSLFLEETMLTADAVLAESAAAVLEDQVRDLEKEKETLDRTTPAGVTGALPDIGALEAAKPKKKILGFRTWLAKNYGTLSLPQFRFLTSKKLKQQYLNLLTPEQAKMVKKKMSKNKEKNRGIGTEIHGVQLENERCLKRNFGHTRHKLRKERHEGGTS